MPPKWKREDDLASDGEKIVWHRMFVGFIEVNVYQEPSGKVRWCLQDSGSDHEILSGSGKGSVRRGKSEAIKAVRRIGRKFIKDFQSQIP
jgi:hypothetical protein